LSKPSMRIVALLLGCAGACVCASAPAAAQGSYSPYDETATSALARYLRTLASDPKDFSALIGAGRAALETGDTQAAAGFFARADEVNPRSPLPQAGMGAVAVANGEPQAAFPYFARAQQLGAPVATFGVDRGLAYDLLGQQAQAQADYRASLGGPDSDEARRRLAMSLAISGNRAAALEALAQARNDPATGRCRAFVLALTGDSTGAMTAIDRAMPGSWAAVSPFLQRLPTLTAGQKAAAVNLGIFPDSGAPAYATASAPASRLGGIDDFLRAPAAPPPPPVAAAPVAPQQPTWQPSAPVKVASAAPAQVRRVSVAGNKVWLQLASGRNPDALPGEFRKLKSKNHDLFTGIKGYVARSPQKARLVIGPFRGATDAEIFADDLQSVGIDAFRWTNSESDTIVPLGTE
jgi:Flp pilus assembly protein TadD